jgi:hypothetical protein
MDGRLADTMFTAVVPLWPEESARFYIRTAVSAKSSGGRPLPGRSDSMPGIAQLTGTSDVFDMALPVRVGLQGIAGGMPICKGCT